MGARFRVWMDGDRSSPELAGAGSSVRDRRRSCHARRLGRIQIQRGAGDDSDPVVTPMIVRKVAHARDSNKNDA